MCNMDFHTHRRARFHHMDERLRPGGSRAPGKKKGKGERERGKGKRKRKGKGKGKKRAVLVLTASFAPLLSHAPL